MKEYIKRLFDVYDERSLNNAYRRKRFIFFLSQLEKLKSDNTISILDIGGTQAYWEKMNFVNSEKVHITLLNRHLERTRYKNFTSIQNDACNLSDIKDKEFDIVHSNSVIEHLCTKENQIKMANEVRRVGKYYYVQTPDYSFPIEPHWVFPFFHYLPFIIRVFLTRYVPLSTHASDIETAKRLVREVRLLTKREMKSIFPEGEVYSEKICGLTKSLTMYYFPE